MILILVLSARREPWGALMDAQMATWDSVDNPNTRTLYYCGKSPLPSEGKVFYSNYLTESLEDVSPRTIEAFEVALNLDWDYLARPHSSSYVHKQNLVDYCATLPKENVVCGCMTTGDSPFIWGGCHYIFSRDVIERIVKLRDIWNRHVMDDQSITLMVKHHLEIQVRNGRSATINYMPDKSYLVMVYGIGENFYFYDWSDIKKAHPHFFFRCKQDLQRHLDIEIMHKLQEHYT